MPKANVAFWKKKLEGNRRRDRKNTGWLRDNGWRVFVVRERELRQNAEAILDHLAIDLLA